MAWRGWIAAKDSFEFNDVTADLGLPRSGYWIAVLTGLVGAALAALLWRCAGKRSHERDRDRDARRRGACWC